MKHSENHICIVGCGAIGALYGGKLAQVGYKVDVIARHETDEIAKLGIRIESVWGSFNFKPNAVFSKIEDCSNQYDIVLVAVKALPQHQSEAFVKSVGRLLKPNSAIFVIQNGLNSELPYAKYLPTHSIIGGLAFVCSNRISPRLVHHIDYGRLVLALYSGSGEILNSLIEAFTEAGVPVKSTANLIEARWSKLIWNIAFNPLSVICDSATTKQLLEMPETAALCRALMTETVQVAEHIGIHLPEGIIDRNMNDTLSMPAYKTSMLLDYEANRPMEIEAIVGELLRTAQANSLEVPHISTIYAILNLISARQSSNR